MIGAATPPRRVEAIDVARAAAMIGVALNHSVNGVSTSGLLSAGHPLEAANAALHMFRMPALAFLLGLFIPRAIRWGGRTGYVFERTCLMFHLYFLWYFLQRTVGMATRSLKNSPDSPESLWTVWAPFADL